jgi:galactokinase
MKETANHAVREFAKIYGGAPQWLAAAPGRVNLIGEHTDYNDGFVMPMAIERYTVIAAAPARDTGRITLRSTANHEEFIIRLGDALKPLGRGKWANYAAGVVAGFLAHGVKPGGFDALVHSNVPLGGGLSSSAALEVATATLLEAITGRALDPVEKALLCQQAEHDFAGMPCGIMDQFISVLGRAGQLLLLDCRSRQPELVPMTDPTVTVLIINTNVKHELTGSEYPTRRKQCEAAAKALGLVSLRDATPEMLEQGKNKMDEVVYRRARHVIGEIRRTVQAAQAVRDSNWPAVGEFMYASHDSLKDDYEVSCKELDIVVDIARSIGWMGGLIGCRMTGGGFGGCAVALVKTNTLGPITEMIAKGYKARTGIEPAIFSSRPAAGATILKG